MRRATIRAVKQTAVQTRSCGAGWSAAVFWPCVLETLDDASISAAATGPRTSDVRTTGEFSRTPSSVSASSSRASSSRTTQVKFVFRSRISTPPSKTSRESLPKESRMYIAADSAATCGVWLAATLIASRWNSCLIRSAGATRTYLTCVPWQMHFSRYLTRAGVSWTYLTCTAWSIYLEGIPRELSYASQACRGRISRAPCSADVCVCRPCRLLFPPLGELILELRKNSCMCRTRKKRM